MGETEPNGSDGPRRDRTVDGSSEEESASIEANRRETGRQERERRETGRNPKRTTTRRTLLAAVGAGVVAGGGGSFGTGLGSAQPETTSGRRYVECGWVRINRGEFPEDVRLEIDEAMESGTYESDRPPRLLETMDVDASYVFVDGTAYTPLVEQTTSGTYRLTLETVANPTLTQPRTIRVPNRSDESQTLTVRVEEEDEQGDLGVLFDGTVEIDPDERRTVWGTDVIGTYDLTIETRDGQHVEDTFHVSEGGSTSVDIDEDGDVQVYQAVAGIAPCEFDPESDSSTWVELEVETDRLEPGERTTVDLLLTYTTEGIAEYDLEVSVVDAAVAQLTDIQYAEAFDAGDDPVIASDGSAATLRAVDTNEAVPSTERFVRLATVELEATDDVETAAIFETRVDVTVESMTDDGGATIDAGGDSDSITVANPEGRVGAGIDQYAYSRDSRGLGRDERDRPDVTIGDDTVVVHGSSATGPSTCGGEELTELAFDEADGDLAVTVSGPNDPHYEPGGCTTDVAAVSYELVATLEESPAETVTLTELAYARSGTVVIGRPDEPRPAVRGVEDFEFTLVDRDPERSDDVERDPAVTLENGTVVVSGTIGLSSIGCQTVEPALIAYDSQWGRLVVEVTDTLAAGVDPDQPCPGAAGFQGYELRVPVDADSLRRVTAVHPSVDGTRLVSVDGGDLEEHTPRIEVNGYTPQDLDGDGLYHDVDGNGTVGTNDVVTFFEHLEEPGVMENVEAFDFAGTGEVSTTDVVDLFQSL